MTTTENDTQAFSKEEFDALMAELREDLRPPEIKPICKEMDVGFSGTKLIKALPDGEEPGEYRYAAAISVFSLRFRPDASENLDLLHRHVTRAVEALADISPEFESPQDYESMHTAYQRPEKRHRNSRTGEKEGYVYNAYVFQEDGEVIVQGPLILSDVIHVYNALHDVIIPERETFTHVAREVERARWLEVRGPIMSTDDPVQEKSYSYTGVLPEDKLGCLYDVDEKDIIDSARREAVLLRVAGLSTDDELVGHMVGLAMATSAGLLRDASGHYLPLPAPSAKKAIAEIRQEQVDFVSNRARDMLHDALEQVGESAGAHPGKAFHRAEAVLGPKVRDVLEEQRQRDAEDYARLYALHSKPRRPSAFSKKERHDQDAAEALSDRVSGKKYVKREESGSFLATRSGVGFAGSTIPFFLPRVYRRKVWDEEIEAFRFSSDEYRSRPSGYVYAPIIALSKDLEAFIDHRDAGQPQAVIRDLLGGPQAG